MPIRILPPELASQIAAGEVVERPASVVRELLDNALDAGASRVRVEVERGGSRNIVVIDDGCGMNPEDAVLSIERHSTSKIATLEDLQQIETLGFRGEALASIASVSRLVIETREAASPVGTRVRVEGGVDRKTEEAGLPVGTTVRVADLFYNVPARRKFLRAESTELRHTTEAVTRAALAWESVHFQLFHNRREVLDLPRAESRFDRVAAILGRSVAERLLPVFAESGGMVVEGFVAAPTEHRRSAEQVYFILNGRYISNRMLLSALLRGFENALPPRRYPVAVLFLEISPREVDVNVHPTKLEVKFANEGRVFSLVAGGVRQALESGTGLPATTAEEVPEARTTGAEGEPSADVGLAARETPVRPDAAPREPSRERTREPTARPGEPSADTERRARIKAKVEEFARRSSPPGTVPRFPVGPVPPAPGKAGREPSQPVIVPERAAPRALAQILDTYILCTDGKGLIVLDMHAAHERLRYEELKRAAAGQAAASQSLLFPHRVEFSVGEAQVVEENLEVFRRLGFDLEPFGGGSFLVTRMPALLRTGQLELILRDVVVDLREQGSSDTVEAVTEKILITVACHDVLRSGDRVDPEEMQALVDRLMESPNAHTCPHGRPTWIRFSREELEKLFKRTGF